MPALQPAQHDSSGPPGPVQRVNPGVLAGVSLWRLVIVASALYGFSDATGWSRNFEGLSQQASLLTGIVYIGLLAYPAITGGTRHEPKSPWLRGATAVLLLLVAGTFFGIMGGDFDYLPFEHVYTPLLVLVDWIAVGRNQAAARWWHPLTWIAFPLAYLAYFLSAGVYRSLYEFLDPREDGFAVMIAGLLVGVIAVGYLLYGIGRLKAVLDRGNRTAGQQPPAPRPGPAMPGPPPGPPGPGWSSPPGLGRPGPPANGGPPHPAYPAGSGVPGGTAAPPPPGIGKRLAIAATIGALVVAIGTVGGLLVSSGGQSSARGAQEWAAAVDEVGAATELWRAWQGDAPEAQGAGDRWVTDTHLVRRLPGRVAAYDLDTGEVAWEFPLPGDPADDCPSSQQHSGNRVALLRMTGAEENDCGTVTVLDIATGQEVFTAEIPPIDREEVTTADVPAVIGENVLVGSRAGGHLFNIDTGKHVAVAEEGLCREDAYAVVDEVLVARVSCRERPPGSDVALSGLRAYDAELEQLWQWKAPQEGGGEPQEVRSVLSVEPLVVELHRSSTDTYEMARVDRVTDESVTLLTRDRTIGDDNLYLQPCDEHGIAHCEQARIADDKLVLTTISHQINPDTDGAYPGMANTEYRNELVALDLATGDEAWRTGMVDGRALHLVPTTDGSVVAYQSANPNDVSGLLLSVDAATGTLSPLLPIPAESHEDDDLTEYVRSGRLGGDDQQAVWAGGHFVIFGMVHRAETIGDLETVAFGLPE